MTDELTVCHVVNTIGETNLPADLATAQIQHEAVDAVGILAWFDVSPFQDDETVERYCLDVSSGKFHLTRRQYTKAKRVLAAYDIVHVHHPHSGFYGKLLAKRLGKSIISTEHNIHDGFSRKGRISNGVTNVLADRVVPVSESVRESFEWWERRLLPDEKIRVINNGVDIERLEAAKAIDWSIYDAADIDPEAVVVGSAGMLVEQKAHDVLIEAVNRANTQSDRPIELVISGAGELRDELEAQIVRAEHSDRLHLLGFLERREQVHEMLHEIDIYAMPSRWEGFCVAALEAMAIGNACVFSDIPEFRHPFAGAARFHPPDDAGKLSEELLGCLSADRRTDLSDAARQLISEEYTIERTVIEYQRLYEQIR